MLRMFLTKSIFFWQPGLGSISKKAGGGPQIQNVATQIQGSLYSQGPWDLTPQYPQSFQHINREGGGRAGQLSFSITAPPAAQRMPPSFDTNNNNYPNQPAHFQSQLLKPEEARESFTPSIPAQVSSHLGSQPLIFGHTPQGYNPRMNFRLLNQTPFSSVPIRNMQSNTSFLLQGGGALPPPPPGLPPSSHLRPSQNMGPRASFPQANSGFTGLISSLMAHGLISLTAPSSDQVSFLIHSSILIFIK